MRKQDIAQESKKLTPLQAIVFLSALVYDTENVNLEILTDSLKIIGMLAGHLEGGVDKEIVVELMKTINIELITDKA